MKIIIFTHVFPYPLNEGGRIAQYAVIEYLVKENGVVLLLPQTHTSQADIHAFLKK